MAGGDESSGDVSRSVLERRDLARFLVFAALALPAGVGLAEKPGEPSASEKAALRELSGRAKGFVVWESNRTGRWELYRRSADGTGFRRLTSLAGKGGRPAYDAYLRPRVSPDGGTILFAYGRKGKPCEVWLVSSEGGDAHRLTVGNPLRWSAGGREILFVRDHHVWRRELASTKESVVHPAKVPPSGANGSMVGDVRADLKAAVFRTQKNEYFVFDRGETVKTTGGCEPGFGADGRYLYWVQGPRDFRVWNIATGEERTFLARPEFERWDYTYFPTVSGDGRWLAYGASPAQHSHTTSDYEIFLQELHGWKPVGKPVRLSWNPRTDRWPFLHAPDGRPMEAALADLVGLPAAHARSMERWRGWSLAQWASPGRMTLPELASTNGAPLVVEMSDAAGKDKLAMVLPVSLDLSGAKQLLVRARNRGHEPVGVAVALTTTGANVYHELPAQDVAPGSAVQIAFDLGAPRWKTAATGWRHGARLAGARETRALTVLIYHRGKRCSMALDKVRCE